MVDKNMDEDYDIGPNEVRIKTWTTISTQTPRDELYEEAARIVTNYEEIEKRWKVKQREERDKYMLGAFLLGFGIGIGVAFGGILGFSFIRILCNNE